MLRPPAGGRGAAGVSHGPPVRPYDPAHPCPLCGAEGGQPVHHREPLLAVFGGAPQWACVLLSPGTEVKAHFCSKCEICGFAWMENVPDMQQQ